MPAPRKSYMDIQAIWGSNEAQWWHSSIIFLLDFLPCHCIIPLSTCVITNPNECKEATNTKLRRKQNNEAKCMKQREVEKRRKNKRGAQDKQEAQNRTSLISQKSRWRPSSWTHQDTHVHRGSTVLTPALRFFDFHDFNFLVVINNNAEVRWWTGKGTKGDKWLAYMNKNSSSLWIMQIKFMWYKVFCSNEKTN